MSDFSSFPIPPKNIGGIEKAPEKREPKGPAVPQAGQPTFEQNLKEALGQVSEQAKQVSNTTPNFEDVGSAMEAAKNAFEDTMHAHQMMQNLMSEIETPNTPADEKQED